MARPAPKPRTVTWSAFIRNVSQATSAGCTLVTKRGKPLCIAVGLDGLEDSEAMVLLLAMAERDRAAGRTIPQQQVFDDIRQRLRRRSSEPVPAQRRRKKPPQNGTSSSV